MLAISTAWNYKVDGDPRRLLSEIKKTGLDAIELGYRVTNDHLQKMIPLLPEIGLKVASIHNFCPVPYDEVSPRHPSNHYRMSSLDERERQKAVYWTNHTIDVAAQVGAKVVVIHAGTVELENDPTPALLEMYRQGQHNTREFAELRTKLIAARRAKQEPYREAIVKSFQEIMAHARKKNILIGLETRYYPVEIPNYEEIGIFLKMFRDQGMYYWHDVGHAEVNGRLGIAGHEDYLKSYVPELIGWHLHGVKVLRDHLAPFQGDFDLTKVLPFIKKEHIKVIESHINAPAEQIMEAVKKLS